ncbi:hypothetical protein KR018_000298 [Drosophila ironensis]|nr:hypothetical protein KR018_000298 [Drosophila ironensis]
MPPAQYKSHRKDGNIAGTEGKQPQQEDLLSVPMQILSADPSYRIKPMQQVMSALVGGLLTTFVVTPLEVVKTRVQTQHTVRQRPTVNKLCYVFHNGLMTHVCRSTETCMPKRGHNPSNLRPVRGSMDTFFKILCDQGMRGLWAGLSPTLVSALPSTIIYFLAYEYLKTSLSRLYFMSKQMGVDDSALGPPHGRKGWQSKKPQNVHSRPPVMDGAPPHALSVPTGMSLPYFVPMAAGVMSRAIVVSAVTPIEMVRIKMQTGVITYTELWRVMRILVQKHGVRGLWRGWPPTILRDAPFSGIYWAAYETMKRAFRVPEPSFLFSFLAGACSGALATLVTMPFDLITTHTQIELGQDVLYEGEGKDKPGKAGKRTVFGRLRYIYRQQGLRALYAGVMPRMLRVMPACAIMISTFEYSKSFFFHRNLGLQEACKFCGVV